MIVFILGMILGIVLTASASSLILRRRTRQISYDLALLRARLRTVMRLVELELLLPSTVEAARVLDDLSHFVTDDVDDHSEPAATKVQRRPVQPAPAIHVDDVEEDLPPIFHRE